MLLLMVHEIGKPSAKEGILSACRDGFGRRPAQGSVEQTSGSRTGGGTCPASFFSKEAVEHQRYAQSTARVLQRIVSECRAGISAVVHGQARER